MYAIRFATLRFYKITNDASLLWRLYRIFEKNYDRGRFNASDENAPFNGRMPPVLGGATAMAVLPASPQTAAQGNTHTHSQVVQNHQALMSNNEAPGSAAIAATTTGPGGGNVGLTSIASLAGVVGVTSQTPSSCLSVSSVSAAAAAAAASASASAAAAAQQPQQQLLYQPYNLMSADSPSQNNPNSNNRRVYPHPHNRHQYYINQNNDSLHTDSINDSTTSLTVE